MSTLIRAPLGTLHQKLPKYDPKKLKQIMTKPLYKPLVTANHYFECKEKFERIKFNAESLDNITDGIDTGSITEIYGLSGSGKTQICLQLALNCQLPINLGGLDGKVIYISTEKLIPIQRLQQLANVMREKYKDCASIPFLDNIFVYEFNSTKSLEKFVFEDLGKILEKDKENVKLLIIDSIAGIYRIEMNYLERARSICRNFRHMQRLATKYNFAVLATNQVSCKITKLKSTNIPAIGQTWTSMITTRFYISKTNHVHRENNQTFAIRKIYRVLSPRLPRSTAFFTITSCGILSIAREKLFVL